VLERIARTAADDSAAALDRLAQAGAQRIERRLLLGVGPMISAVRATRWSASSLACVLHMPFWIRLAACLRSVSAVVGASSVLMMSP
jgi:hypothetical protein